MYVCLYGKGHTLHILEVAAVDSKWLWRERQSSPLSGMNSCSGIALEEQMDWGVTILVPIEAQCKTHTAEHHPSPSTLAWIWCRQDTSLLVDSNSSPVDGMWRDGMWHVTWETRVIVSTHCYLRSGGTTDLQILAKYYLCRCHSGNYTERCSTLGFENSVWFSRKNNTAAYVTFIGFSF